MHDLNRLLAPLRRHQARLATGFACVLGATVFSLLWPLFLRFAVDDLTAGGDGGWLLLFAAGIVGSAAAEGVLRFFMRFLVVGLSRQIEYELRNELFAHLQRLDLGFFQRTRTGDVVARATNDLNAVRQLYGFAVLHLFNTAITFTSTLALMFAISPRLTLWCGLILPAMTGVFALVRRQVEERFQRVQEQFGALSDQAQESFSGIRVIKAYAQESAEVEDFSRTSQEYVARQLIQVRIAALLWPLMTVIGGLTIVGLIYLGGRDVIEGRLTVGQFVQFGAYLAMLTWPMIALGWVFNLVQQGLASWKRVASILSTEPTIRDAADAESRTQVAGEIELRDVSLELDGRRVLNHVHLTIPAGTTLGVVGATGSGKSLLVSLIPRLLDPNEGTVLVDSVDVRRLRLAHLRQHVGYVPQESFLFSDTLRNNVTFGVENASDAEIERALELSQLRKDLEQLPQGLDTLVGERGVTLSGGQKQRAALARALLRDSRILILDDALASVDAETEERILAGLREFVRRRTSVIVSHRISAVRDADQIIVLDGGEIVERGTHASLLALGGRYADLHRRQTLSRELQIESSYGHQPATRVERPRLRSLSGGGLG